MIFLRQVLRIKRDNRSDYPFHMSIINDIESISFDKPITFFIGENGSGKTTLLETIMMLTNTVNLLPEESRRQEGPKRLSKSFKAVWHKKTSRGFYLKSQSFINFIEHMDSMKRETQKGLDDLKKSFEGRSSYALELAQGPYNKTLSALEDKYGKGLDKMSHGEGYMELFKSRLVPKGLYILDEPELSLSPMRQLALISLIKEMISQDCQFIIITHSPILMAMKESIILDFDNKLSQVDYEQVAHVQLTKEFLNHPDSFLKYL